MMDRQDVVAEVITYNLDTLQSGPANVQLATEHTMRVAPDLGLTEQQAHAISTGEQQGSLLLHVPCFNLSVSLCFSAGVHRTDQTLSQASSAARLDVGSAKPSDRCIAREDALLAMTPACTAACAASD
jgi:hypothetical protein